MSRLRAALAVGGLCSACARSDGEPRIASEPPPPRPAPVAPAPRAAPSPPPIRELGDFLGRRVEELGATGCADAKGFRVERGLVVEDRPLAVRRCERFSDEDPATLTLISDAGRIVFAVSSREYELTRALEAYEARLRALSTSGCEQFASTARSVGFVRCGKGVGWAAVSRVAVSADAGELHAIVFEVAERREIARDIAAAFARNE